MRGTPSEHPPRVASELNKLAREASKCSTNTVANRAYSKINVLRVEEAASNAFTSTGIVDSIQKWCCDASPPLGKGRTLKTRYISKTKRFGFDELRDALMHRNARVTTLCIAQGPPGMPCCSTLLRPLLEHPGNVLSSLILAGLRRIDNEDARELALGLCSSNCRLRHFEMHHNTVTSNACDTILDGLHAVPYLQTLEWYDNHVAMMAVDATAFATKVGRLLEKPGNDLRLLVIKVFQWDHEQVSILARSLTNVHCKLAHLESSPAFKSNIAEPLIQSLSNPNNSLRSLSIATDGTVADSLRESLKSVNCKLESLVIKHDYDAAFARDSLSVAVADALSVATHSRLWKYEAEGRPTGAVFRAFARSLCRPTNKLTTLILVFSHTRYEVCDDFFRALRRSSVTYFGKDEWHPFVRAFNAPFFRVLHTLLSVKHVPRIGSGSWLRVLPVQDFILAIANTLGWPLDDLRLVPA